MAPGSDKIDDLNAIDEAWAELGREIVDKSERPPVEQIAKVNRAEPPDPEIDAMIARLDLLDEEMAGAPPSPPPPAEPEAGATPPPEKRPSRSLMPPYTPPKPRTPERPMRKPSRPALTPPAGPARTLLAFGAPAAPTPIAPVPPTVGRETVPTPVVTVLDADTGEVQSPALTLDLDEMDRAPAASRADAIRKPSAPRVPIDLSEFDASFDAEVAAAAAAAPVTPVAPGAISAPPPELELPILKGPPAVPDSRRRAPTPEAVITPLPPEEAIGFERELDLPTEPGVAKELDFDADGGLDALDAVERAAEPESIVARMEREMRERFDSGDFSAALESAEWLLRDVPGHEQAKQYAASCREVLLQMYAARLGSLERVPSIVVGATELKNLGLDHRAGFVLSCIDGRTSFAEILDLAGMPPLESYRILCDLILAHVIAVR